MKRGFLLSSALVLTIALSLSACHLNMVHGKGPMKAKDFDLAGFTGVEASSAMKVTIHKADRFKVSVSAQENLLPYVEAEKRGDVLCLRLKPEHSYTNLQVEAHVYMPELAFVGLSGACQGHLDGEWQAQDFKLELSGACSLDGAIAMEDGVMDISGASSVSLTGKARSLTAEASGASKLRMARFSVDRLTISLSGASSGEMQVEKVLDAEASGASSFEYTGNPEVKRTDTSGASDIDRKN